MVQPGRVGPGWSGLVRVVIWTFATHLKAGDDSTPLFCDRVLAALDRNPPARPWVACSVLRVACGPSFRVVPCRFAVSPVGFVGPCAGSRVVL